jgi:pimeloyl-ACP methyl ester carboxylesterase
MMRRTLPLFVTIVLVVAGLQTGAFGAATAAPVAPAASTIEWGRCADPSLRAEGARCAMLAVPLDYDDPTGPTIRIALSRVRHTVPDASYQGVMLVNPGGPGGSGLWWAALGQYVPDGAGDAYDWIGFDPRGVGASRPAISCNPNYFHGDRPPYVPTTQKLEDKWLARTEGYAAACGESAAELLPHMTTVDAVMDMESIRVALGVEQINYFGFSYGTYLGQVYATLYPGQIRRAVFDGTVDPTNVWYEANLLQDIGFDRNIRIWFAWLAEHRDVFRVGRTENAVARRFFGAQEALKEDPAGGVVGPAEWNDAFLYAAYYQSVWTWLGKVFSGWVNEQRVNRLIGAYEWADGPGDDNGYAVYSAVQCTDTQWPQDWETWETDNWAVHEQAPFATWNNAWYNAPCLFWPAPAGTATTVVGDETPVLMISETLDAATPYEGSLTVRSVFPNAVLIAEPGGITHAGSLYGNACVDDPIAAFLATGELPERLPGEGPDVECEPLPPPVPSSAAHASRPADLLEARLLPLVALR